MDNIKEIEEKLNEAIKIQPLELTEEEKQIFETMRWYNEIVIKTFHVPYFVIGHNI